MINNDTHLRFNDSFPNNRQAFRESGESDISDPDLEPIPNEFKKLKSEEEIFELKNGLNLPDLESKPMNNELKNNWENDGNLETNEMRFSDAPFIPTRNMQLENSPIPNPGLNNYEFKKFIPSSEKLITIEENKREEDFLFEEKSYNGSFEKKEPEKPIKISPQSKTHSKKQMRKIKSRKLRRRLKGTQGKVKSNMSSFLPYLKK